MISEIFHTFVVVNSMTTINVYRDPSAMEPLFPENYGELESLALLLLEKSSALTASLHPKTASAVAKFLRPMNSYYSNLIEGHDTHPIDIEKALKKNFSNDARNRSLQQEALAHISVSETLFLKPFENTFNPYSIGFIKHLHKLFYEKLPNDLRVATSMEEEKVPIIPGEFRTCEVQVGRHIAPAFESLEAFLTRFESFYDANSATNKDKTRRIISIAAAHHRLAWIHPFADGNGRVVRLFSDACFFKEDINTVGLWSMARGLARSDKEYKMHLANADAGRWDNYDGRGNLSNKMLVQFCHFFLTTAIDQVDYMKKMLDIDNMLERINAYVDLMVGRGVLKTETRYVLEAVFLKGEIPKKDVERLTNKSDKTAKLLAESLLNLDLLTVDKTNHLAPYKANYPISSSPFLFPNLFPSSKEIDMLNQVIGG